jgi:hypothetical protein
MSYGRCRASGNRGPIRGRPCRFAPLHPSSRRRELGLGAATTVSGIVLDNAQQPVPGVTVSVLGTMLNTQTDSAGHFRLQAVPPGTLLACPPFVVTQRFAFACLCATAPGQIKTLTGPILITRWVSPNADGTWQACIKKSGVTDCRILP